MTRRHHLLVAIGVSAMVMTIGAAAFAVVGNEAPEEIAADSDGDGLSDDDEVNIFGTNPLVEDTDNDGLSDGEEVLTYLTDPLVEDTDNDGLSDGEEVLTYLTDPLVEDTDNDGLLDGEEVSGEPATDPLDPDSDNDGVLDGDEVKVLMTDPTNPNSDSSKTIEDESLNEINDGDEDFDGDGLTNAEELYVYHTDPLVANEIVGSGDCKATFDNGILVLTYNGEVSTYDLTSEMTGKKLNHGRVVSRVAHEAPKECHGEIVSAVAKTDWGKAGDPVGDEPNGDLIADLEVNKPGPPAKQNKKPKKTG